MEGGVAVSVLTPPVSIQPPVTLESTESAAPDRPVTADTSPATAMDTSEDSPQTQIPDVAPTAETPAAGTPENPPETSRGDETPAETPPPPPPPVQEEEPAPWADIEEDLSTPDEAELREIEASDGDYSAYECETGILSPPSRSLVAAG